MSSLLRRCVVAWLCACAAAQRGQQAFGANGQPQRTQRPPTLHGTVLEVFDKDKSGGLSLDEVTSTLDGLAGMAGVMGGGQQPAPGQQSDPEKMVLAAKKVAPTLFNVLDRDGDGDLNKKELQQLTKVEYKLKSGALRNLTRDVFDAIDADKDDTLSAAELDASSKGEPLERVLALVREVFPEVAGKEGAVLDEAGGVSAGLLKAGIEMLDGDGDGAITRKEAGKAFASFKKTFVAGATMLKEMGPMLSM